jgi:aminoglycoside phosphotransferase (APT) family kinase protein
VLAAFWGDAGLTARRHGAGRIHQTWHLTAPGGVAWLLQKINASVFPDVAALTGNLLAVTRHLRACLDREGASEPGRRVLDPVPARGGSWWHEDSQGDCWRAFRFIAGAHAIEHGLDEGRAREAGRAFGTFIRLMSWYDGPPLRETIPGFHDTSARLGALREAARRDPCGRATEAAGETATCLAAAALLLPGGQRAGELPARICHNDCKPSNVLLDDATGRSLCVIDLDTVMTGLAIHDFGDLVRSAASSASEEESDTARVEVRLPLFRAVAAGWLEGAGELITAAEREQLVRGAQLITLEQAARFLADHLDGDSYYGVRRPGENLGRARNQLALLESLMTRERELCGIVAEAWSSRSS